MNTPICNLPELLYVEFRNKTNIMGNTVFPNDSNGQSSMVNESGFASGLKTDYVRVRTSFPRKWSALYKNVVAVKHIKWIEFLYLFCYLDFFNVYINGYFEPGHGMTYSWRRERSIYCILTVERVSASSEAKLTRGGWVSRQTRSRDWVTYGMADLQSADHYGSLTNKQLISFCNNRMKLI